MCFVYIAKPIWLPPGISINNLFLSIIFIFVLLFCVKSGYHPLPPPMHPTPHIAPPYTVYLCSHKSPPSLQTKVHTKFSINITDRPRALPNNSLVWFLKSVSLSALLPSSFPSLYLLTSPPVPLPSPTSPSAHRCSPPSPLFCPLAFTLSLFCQLP
jgi:hypothetical protein